MEDLSKQQLILLALLVSFVTALATGIVTVSLMNQYPTVTKTISQVIEKTVQQIAPQDAAVNSAVLSFHDETADAVSRVMGSIVKFKSSNSNSIMGHGLVLSKSGVILGNKSVLASLSDIQAILNDGTTIPMTVIQSQTSGDIAFLMPLNPDVSTLGKISDKVISTDSTPLLLGQTVFSLSGNDTPVLTQGLITSIATTTSDTNLGPIGTSITSSKVDFASPLFNIKGAIIGVRISSQTDVVADGAYFYPIEKIRSVMPIIK
jgi:S1-C subfamily serine protease